MTFEEVALDHLLSFVRDWYIIECSKANNKRNKEYCKMRVNELTELMGAFEKSRVS